MSARASVYQAMASSSQTRPGRQLPSIPAQEDTHARDRELWREEYVAVEGPGAPSTTEIGPLDLKVRHGVELFCSGPSEVQVTTYPERQFMPVRAHCESSEGGGGQIPLLSINASPTFIVTANTDTSWQLVIFDPAPE